MDMAKSAGTGAVMKKKKHLKKYITLYLIFLPVAIWYIIFKYIPMGGIIIAFKSFSPMKGIGGSPFVGMANFERLFKSSAFLFVLKNNIILSVMDICIVFPAPIILALSINEVKNKMGKRVVQSITYLPHFISWAVAGGLFYMFFSVSTGPVNAVIKAAGGAGINFMGSSVWYRWMVVLSSVWKEVGWGSIVYLAAITGVDEELYEAAAIDGANRWNCLRYITLPGISSVISVMLIMRVGAILSLNFDQTFAMLNDSVLSVGETIEYYVYRVGMSSVNNYSLGTAIGLFKSLIGFVMVLGANWASKRISEDGGIW